MNRNGVCTILNNKDLYPPPLPPPEYISKTEYLYKRNVGFRKAKMHFSISINSPEFQILEKRLNLTFRSPRALYLNSYSRIDKLYLKLKIFIYRERHGRLNIQDQEKSEYFSLFYTFFLFHLLYWSQFFNLVMNYYFINCRYRISKGSACEYQEGI